MKPATAPQLEMDVEDPEQAKRERETEADVQAILFEKLLAACRAITRNLTAEYCAKELDAIWGDRGRPVSAAVLRAALGDSRGNYFRLEWAVWYARQEGGEKVAEVLLEIMGATLPQKTTEEELEDLQDILRAEYPRQAERLIRKAKQPRLPNARRRA